MGFTPNNSGVGTSVSIGEIEAAVVVTAAEGISGNNNDTTLPTSAAVKAYADTKGDASTNTSSSVDSEIAVFSGTGGKTLKRATGTGVVRVDSGVMSVDSDITDLVSAADLTTAGKIEVATAAETTTGTDATRAVSPDSLAGSDFGKRVVGIQVFDAGTDTATGDGKAFFRIPSTLNGYNLVGVAMNVYTAGTTNTTDVQIRNVTQAADMLTTKLTIDSTETDTSTAATAAVIDTGNDDVATGDKIAIDVDAVHTTAAKGLYVELTFQLP